MTRKRWIADKVEGERAFLLGQNAQHLSQVLRAKVGQRFDISCGDNVREGTIVALLPESIEFELGAALAVSGFTPEISLLLAVFKFDRMEWGIEKATELGVSRIIPVIARRTDAHLAAAAIKRVERWRKIAHEASQQARRHAEPEISPPAKLKAVLAANELAGLSILLNETERSMSLKSALETCNTNNISLAIGPEGGWTEDEVALFAKHGWLSASLGGTILRTETAALAALALAQSSLSHSVRESR